MKQRRWIVIAAAGWLVAAAAHAQRVEAPTAEQVRQRLDAAKARLNLTPEQEQRMRPVVEEEAKQLREIQEKYAGILDRVALYLPYRPGDDDTRWRMIVRAFQ